MTLSARRIELGDVVGYRYRIQTPSKRLLGVCAELTRYVHGGVGTQPPSLETQMAGRIVGEAFSISLPSRQDFGDLRRRRLVTLPRSRFPGKMQHHLEPGMRVETETSSGERLNIWVASADEREVTVDFDPPGDALCFDVSIVSIRSATEAEKMCGHLEARWPRMRAADAGTP